jgi:hypothetical protein
MCAPRGACDAPWHHRAPSAPQIRQVVRAPCRIRNIAAFNRDSFAREQPARRRALLLPPTLSAFRLGEPTPSCHEIWHPLSSGSAWRAFLHPPPLASPHRKARRDECHRTRASCATPRLGDAAQGDSECLRLARPSLSRREAASEKRDRPSAAARTPSSHTLDARPVRVVGLPSLLSHRAATAPACRPPHGRGTSRQSLQPTCCHEYPRSHAIPKPWALALMSAATLLALQSGWEPSHPPVVILGDAGLPLLASPALGRPRSWCCAGRLLPDHHPLQGCAVSHAWLEWALSALLAPDDPARRRPVSLPAARARHPEPRRESQSPCPRIPTKGCRSSGPRRLPPASPTVDARARARTATAWAATGTPALPPRAQLPTCFHAPTPGDARPKSLPAVRRSAGATCRLPASAMECPPSTPTCRPIPGFGRGKPRPTR